MVKILGILVGDWVEFYKIRGIPHICRHRTTWKKRRKIVVLEQVVVTNGRYLFRLDKDLIPLQDTKVIQISKERFREYKKLLD